LKYVPQAEDLHRVATLPLHLIDFMTQWNIAQRLLSRCWGACCRFQIGRFDHLL